MPADHFDEIWAIDWSGARGRYRGVAVARLRRDRVGLEILHPDGVAHWTRSAAVDRLIREIRSGKRLLVGFDFAFSLPRSALDRLGLGRAATMSAVWAAVEAVCAADDDHFGGGFVAAAAPGVFWERGRRPPGWDGGLRAVDSVCRTLTGVQPESVLKLIGPKQVGRASLAGMRALFALRSAEPRRIAVWPEFADEGGRRSVIVEMFPTLFRRQALGGLAKIRDAGTLDRALAAFGLPGLRLGSDTVSDDVADAVIGVAGLRRWSAAMEALPALRDPVARREGWIAGVPLPERR